MTVARSHSLGYNSIVMHSEELKATVGKALGRIPSGVFVLTASHADKRDAMLASWVQQCAFDPPAISIAVAKNRPIVELIKQAKILGLSVVPENDTTLMKKYARGIKEGEDPFAGVEITTTPGGAIVLQQSLAWLEGQLMTSCDFGGDHELLIARVTSGAMLHGGASFTHLRGSGFHY
jgi:flavin reductase (DIM6/NTAB) family NADH-FMN oxidoreductase RutF